MCNIAATSPVSAVAASNRSVTQPAMCCHHTQCYQCQVCGEIFESAYLASEHVREKHFFPEL